MMIQKLKRIARHPYLLPIYLKVKLGIKPTEKQFLKAIYFHISGNDLNLRDPKTFNDKLNWLKLHQTDLRLSDLVDKVKVKDIIGGVIGHEHIIKTYGVWDCAEKIDYDSLPDKFVLKTNHDSGSYAICRSKATFDYAKAAQKLNRSLEHDYSERFLEKPYKYVERKILAEEFIEENPMKAPDPVRWKQVKFKAPAFGNQYAEIPEEANEQVVNFARTLCAEYPLTNSDFYIDNKGNKYSILLVNTPPGIKLPNLHQYLNKFPDWNIVSESPDALTISKGKDTLELRLIANYEELRDFKIFCFNGEAKMYKVDFDRSVSHKANYYDSQNNLLPFGEECIPRDPQRMFRHPHELADVLRMAQTICSSSEVISPCPPFVRIDFFIVGHEVYFGEYTLYPTGAMNDFSTKESNYLLGSWIKLPKR
ncbi:MAG: hypothetical protein K2M87_02120 [Muribaculaceae bacterium]|nr:hypothetical protein [Muribaculaceae bacterium]